MIGCAVRSTFESSTVSKERHLLRTQKSWVLGQEKRCGLCESSPRFLGLFKVDSAMADMIE